MVVMSVLPVSAADESLTTVVAELGVSNMYNLQGVFEGYFTDTKLEALDDYMDTNFAALQTALNSDGIDVDVLEDLVGNIEDVDITEAMASSAAVDLIAAQKSAVIASLGDVIDRIVTARGAESNTAYAYNMLINYILDEDSVVTYNTSTETYSLDFSAYEDNGDFVAELRQIMPTTFATDNYVDSIDSLETFFEYILNSSDFDTHGTNFRSAIDSWNDSSFYNAYTPASGGGGGGTVVEEPVDEPVVEEPVTEETADGETTVTSDVENAAAVTTNEDGTEEAVVDTDVVADAIEGVVEAVAAEETEEGETITPVINLNIENESIDVSVAINADTAESLCESNIDICIATQAITYEVPSRIIDVGSVLTDEGDNLDADCEFRFKSAEVDAETVLAGIDGTSDDGVALAEAVEGKSKIIEFSLDIYKNDSIVGSIHDFDKPLTIKISLADIPDADPNKVGAYYINEETGKPVFMGGRIVTVDGVQMLEFSTMHLSKFAVLEAEISYPDVSSHWAKAYVESMGAKHIVSGYTDGTFLPEKAITRAEFAKLVVEAMNYGDATYGNQFNDVSEADWHSAYIARAIANGVVSGYADGTFKPNENISRLEMAAMLSNALSTRLSGDEQTVLGAFADHAAIATWGTEAAAITVEAGLMNGMSGDFNAQGTTTRAQAATAIYRLYNK